MALERAVPLGDLEHAAVLDVLQVLAVAPIPGLGIARDIPFVRFVRFVRFTRFVRDMPFARDMRPESTIVRRTRGV
ncbi:MAG: hypothetical protein H7138_15920 [Myxococcales bacterium]|nr:hypothetical protein [Myxococcales bacterium]